MSRNTGNTILVTGAAGFIGFHLAKRLLADGRDVVGLDNLNDYYDPALKRARLDRLEAQSGFTFASGAGSPASTARANRSSNAAGTRLAVNNEHLPISEGASRPSRWRSCTGSASRRGRAC